MYVPRKSYDNWVQKNNNVYIVITHDKFIDKIARKLFNKPKTTNVKLDELGTFVWQMIDDSKTVHDIGQCLIKEFGEKCEPTYERLTIYLRYLNKMGLIRFRKEEYSSV